MVAAEEEGAVVVALEDDADDDGGGGGGGDSFAINGVIRGRLILGSTDFPLAEVAALLPTAFDDLDCLRGILSVGGGVGGTA